MQDGGAGWVCSDPFLARMPSHAAPWRLVARSRDGWLALDVKAR